MSTSKSRATPIQIGYCFWEDRDFSAPWRTMNDIEKKRDFVFCSQCGSSMHEYLKESRHANTDRILLRGSPGLLSSLANHERHREEARLRFLLAVRFIDA